MNKLLYILSIIIIAQAGTAQITLKECVDGGLSNRPDIKSAKDELFLAGLKVEDNKAKHLPQVSLGYDYRYNPIIPTQIIPLGQFNQIPTDETRPIQFGTDWQQNAGINVYQPIMDLAVRSRIKESKLNERIAGLDLEKAEADLALEIAKTYGRVITLARQVDEAIADTLRSHRSYSLVSARFREGKVLKSEVNTALVNHNSNLTSYKKTVSAVKSEKIYLHYLTDIPLERLLGEYFSPIPESLFSTSIDQDSIHLGSIPEFRRLEAEEQLINQQMKTERVKYAPTIGIQGFLGANQFSQTFDPFLADTWFGSSYVGLSVNFSIFAPSESVNAGKQLHVEWQKVAYRREDLSAERDKDLLQKNVEIEKLMEEIGMLERSCMLQKENVALYQARLLNGQLAAAELNLQEAELQKLSSQLGLLREQLNVALVERLHIAGKLSQQIRML